MLGSLIMLIACRGSSSARRRPRWTGWFRRLQLVSAALYSLGHGGNDAQKTMGIIWMLLIAGGLLVGRADLAADLGDRAAAMLRWRLGTLFGGWRIVKTMGQKITKLKPVGGFLRGDGRRDHAVPRHGSRHSGVDHAHDHRRDRRRRLRRRSFRAVRWGVAGNIVWAWILTIPASAVMAAAAWWLGHRFLP